MGGLDGFYAVLPCARLSEDAGRYVKPEVMRKRADLRALLSLPEEVYTETWEAANGMEHSYLLTKSLILYFGTLIERNQLHEAFTPIGPAPLIRLIIASRRANEYVVQGKAAPSSDFSLTPDKDTVAPRMLRHSLPPTKREVLRATKPANWVYNILGNEDVCSVEEPWPFLEAREDSLLAESRLGWSSVGRDKLNLQIWPDLSICEKELLRLLHLPISSLRQVPQITSSGSTPAQVPNFSGELHSATVVLQDLLQFSLYGPLALLAVLRQYEYLAETVLEEVVRTLINAHIADYGGLGREMRKIRADMTTIAEKYPGKLQFGLIEVDLLPLKSEIQRNGGLLLSGLLKELTSEYLGLLNYSQARFKALKSDLIRVPKTVEELQVVASYLEARQDEASFAQIAETLSQTRTISGILEEFQQTLSLEQEEKYWATKVWGAELAYLRGKMVTKLAALQPGFIDQVVIDANSLHKQGEDVKAAIFEFQSFANLQKADEYATLAGQIAKSLLECTDRAALINSREAILRISLSDFSFFDAMRSDFQPFAALWSFASSWLSSWSEWNYRSFHTVDSDSVQAKHSKGVELLASLASQLTAYASPLTVVGTLQEQTRDFQQFVQIIAALRQPAIHERHMARLLEALHLEVSAETVTLQDLDAAGVLGQTQVIEQICHDARNEYEIELVLRTAESEVCSFDLSLETDKDFPGLQYLTGLRKAEETVQELQATLSFLNSSSKYVSYFRQKIEKLAVSLTISLQVIHDIAEFQEQWLRIYPLLQLPDIYLSLKDNSELVDDLQAFYSRQVHVVHSSQSLTVTSDAKIKSFVEAIERCEFLWKGIKKTVLEKTETFPRLLFLSQKETIRLLSSIAKGREIRLSALFPGIESIDLLTPQLSSVLHGSSLLLLQPEVLLTDFGTRVRPEVWLQDLERSLHSSFQAKLAAFLPAEEGNVEWWRDCDDPQVLLVAEEIVFSRLLSDQEPLGVGKAMDKLKELVSGLIAEICPLYGTTDKKALIMFKKPGAAEAKALARSRLEKLVLQVLHQLNFLHSVSSSRENAAFLWKAYFRLSASTGCKRISVTFFDLARNFEFEWAPLPFSLLVWTPMTERCLLNLATSLQTGFSGLLQGPVACDKTETIKEMALMYGKLVLFWSVSGTTHPAAVLQALTAGVCTGAWVCFEEIHLLDTALLNSLAYYLGKIRDLATGPSPKLDIDGRNVTIVPGFALWGTSTAAKSSFSACFSSCFRTIALNKPDLATILEIRLYAIGFTSASAVSLKLARALSLWGADSLAISHVDSPAFPRFSGLRIASLLIDTISKMLDSYVFSDINYLLQNACRRVLGLGLGPQAFAVLEEFLTTVFRSTCNDTVLGLQVQGELQSFQTALREKGLGESEEVLRTLRQMRVCLEENTGRKVTIVVGSVGVGKTTLVRIAIETHIQLVKNPFNVPLLSGQVSNKHIHRLIQACSGSAPTSSLPHLSLHLQDCFSPGDILYLDADISRLDGLLAVARSDIYLQKELRTEIPAQLKVIAEIETLAEVSPALLTETALIYCEESLVPDLPFFLSSLHSPCLAYTLAALTELFRTQFPRVFAAFEACRPAVPLSRRTAISSLSNWLSMLLGPPTLTVPRLTSLRLEAKQQASSLKVQRTEAAERTEVEAAWVVALVGSLGMMVEDRDRFDMEIKALCTEEGFAAGLLKALSHNDRVFDVNYAFSEGIWQKWTELPLSQPPDSVLIPTVSVVRLQHWCSQVLHMHKHCLLLGPHQSGKSLVLSALLRQRVAQDFASVIPLHVLASTTCDSIQCEVERMMDQYRPRHFGALGGRHHYVYLEDMNQDSGPIYDLVRFVSTYGGWYKRDLYSSINDVTFCLAQSYSEHKFRKPNYRALRHFVVLFKEEYSEGEIATLFSALNVDLAQRFAALYGGLRSAVVRLEATWYHSTLANFLSAMHWTRHCAHWAALIGRYFPFLATAEDCESACFCPAVLVDPSGKDSYVQLSPANFPSFLANFDSLVKKCESKGVDSMLKIHKSHISAQISHFTQVVSDFQHLQHSIIATQGDIQPLKAAALLAAEQLRYKVVEIPLFDATSELANSMAERDGHYLPTEVKFAIKQMVDSALKGGKSACLVTIDDQSNLNSPIFRTFMEVCCDIVLGTSLKAYSITRKAHKQYHDLYPDQVLLLQRDLIQANIVFSFLIRSNSLTFDRSRPLGPIEALKHVYRSLFNHCRVVVYEEQQVPKDLVALVEANYQVENADFALVSALSAAVDSAEFDNFAWERITYIAKAMQKREEWEITAELSVLSKALLRIRQTEQELERSEYLLDLQTCIETLRKQGELAKKEIEESIKALRTQPSNNAALIQAEREEFTQVCEVKKSRVGTAAADFMDSVGSVLERPSLYQLILLGALQALVCPSDAPFPFEDPGQYLSHCQSILHRLQTRSKEVTRKLQNADFAGMPDLTLHLDEVRGSPGSQGPLYSLIVALVEAREACFALEEKGKTWNQGKLTNSTREKLLERQIEEGKAQVETLRKSLEEAEERLQAALSLKQKYLRFLHELKPSQRQWTERSSQLDSQLQFTRGNSLLRASVFVLGLGLEKSLRVALKSRIKETLEKMGFPCAIGSQPAQQAGELTAFLRQLAKACEWIWQLGLPYPVFIDSVDIAADLIKSETGLTVIRYSLDMRVDSSLETSLEKGNAVLVVAPTDGMLQTLMPLFKWRFSRSIESAQGIDTWSAVVSLGRKKVKVHPNFRLYLSLPTPPGDLLSKVSTVISLQATDGEAWKAGMLLKLERKSITGRETLPSAVAYEVVNVRTLKAFADCQFTSIYTGSSLQGVVRVWQSDSPSKSISTAESSHKSVSVSRTSLHTVYSLLVGTAWEMQILLFQLELGKWTVPPEMFQKLLILACEEQANSLGSPNDGQIGLYHDAVLYRFLVRLLWTLPVKHQSALLLCYCILKATDSIRAAQAIDLVQQGLQLPYTSNRVALTDRAKALQSKWPLYPESLHPDSKEFHRFLDRDLLSGAVLPETLEPCTQAVVISWLRQDLVPGFVKVLVRLVMGRRFATLPDPELGLVAELSSPTVPISLLYHRRNPLPALRQSAILSGVSLTHLIPLTSKKTLFVSESKLQTTLKALAQACRRKEWLALEGFEALEKTQIELLFLQINDLLHAEEVEDSFRLWLIFPKKTDLRRDWSLFEGNSGRVWYVEPENVRDRLSLSLEMHLNDPISASKQQYGKYSQLNIAISSQKSRKVARVPTMLKNTTPQRSFKSDNFAFSRVSTPTAQGTAENLPSGLALEQFYRFNVGFVTAVIEIRQRFDREMEIFGPGMAIWGHICSVFKEERGGNAGKELILTYFRLIGPNWSESAFYTALNMCKHALWSNLPALKFTSPSGDSLQYPLFQLPAPTPPQQLLTNMPKEDHFHLLGLPHALSRRYSHQKAQKISYSLVQFAQKSVESSPLAAVLTDYKEKLRLLLGNADGSYSEKWDLTEIYEKISKEKAKGFSYFFVPDRYRATDYQLKVLSQPPALHQVLCTLNRSNSRLFALFVREIFEKWDRLVGFLHFRTAQISGKDQKMLFKLQKQRIPAKWRQSGPYRLRTESNVPQYIAKLVPLQLYSQGIVHLGDVMHPVAFLIALIRALTLAAELDIGKIRVELVEFDGNSQENQVLIEDLRLFNASLKGHFLQDSEEESWKLPICTLSVTAAGPEDCMDSCGLSLHYRSTANERVVREVDREASIHQMVSAAFNSPRTSWIEKGEITEEVSAFNRILCPMFPSVPSTAHFSILFYSEKAQSHWTKRGLRLDLP